MAFAVAAGHPQTVEAARQVLQAGGNAADAAVAAFVMSWVVEPLMASAGGGGFATIVPARGKPVVLDFFTHTPRRKRLLEEIDYFPITVDFGGTREDFFVGLGSTAVPGSVAGVFRLHQLFGKTPLQELFTPAMEAARAGVAVNAFQRYNYELLESILRLYPQGRHLFLRHDQLIREGQTLRFPQMADFLDYLWREGPDAFYRGEVARKLAFDYESGGGHLTEADLASYEVQSRTPLSGVFRGKTVLTAPLPSVGGSLILYGLNHLDGAAPEQLPLSQEHLLQVQSIIKQIEPLSQNPGKLALLLRAASVSDSNLGNTTHISIADRVGNAVSLTTSNGQGNGYFVENTDIQMNNMLGEPALLPGGHHSWTPDTRLASMMAPTVVLGARGNAQVVTGSAGAGRIPYAIMQVLHYLLTYPLHVGQAVDYPRIHWHDGTTHVEPGFDYDAETRGRLEPLEQWEKRSLFFGGAHTLHRVGKHWEAAGDSRRDGQSFAG